MDSKKETAVFRLNSSAYIVKHEWRMVNKMIIIVMHIMIIKIEMVMMTTRTLMATTRILIKLAMAMQISRSSVD